MLLAHRRRKGWDSGERYDLSRLRDHFISLGLAVDSIDMSLAVNSFDVFDTLIARRCVEPRRVLDKLEVRSGIPGLAAARLAADRQLGVEGRPYTLTEIWQQVGRVSGLDTPTIQRL